MFAALGPRGCAPLGTPAGGAPLHRTPYKRLRRPCRGPLAEGQGCRGKSAPDTLPAGLGRSGRVKGPCPRPCGAAGRTNPLTRPSLEKTRQRPAQGLGGALSEWMGVKARAATAQRLGLDAQERPQRSGLVAGGAFPPSRLPRGERPRRAAGGALDLLLLRAVSEKQLSAPSARRTRFGSGSEHCKRSLRKCALASLRGLVRRHPVGASRGFTR